MIKYIVKVYMPAQLSKERQSNAELEVEDACTIKI